MTHNVLKNIFSGASTWSKEDYEEKMSLIFYNFAQKIKDTANPILENQTGARSSTFSNNFSAQEVSIGNENQRENLVNSSSMPDTRGHSIDVTPTFDQTSSYMPARSQDPSVSIEERTNIQPILYRSPIQDEFSQRPVLAASDNEKRNAMSSRKPIVIVPDNCTLTSNCEEVSSSSISDAAQNFLSTLMNQNKAHEKPDEIVLHGVMKKKGKKRQAQTMSAHHNAKRKKPEDSASQEKNSLVNVKPILYPFTQKADALVDNPTPRGETGTKNTPIIIVPSNCTLTPSHEKDFSKVLPQGAAEKFLLALNKTKTRRD